MPVPGYITHSMLSYSHFTAGADVPKANVAAVEKRFADRPVLRAGMADVSAALNAVNLARDVDAFLEKHAKTAADYDPKYDEERWNGPDSAMFNAAARGIEAGMSVPPRVSSSYASGCYAPYPDETAEAEHQRLLRAVNQVSLSYSAAELVRKLVAEKPALIVSVGAHGSHEAWLLDSEEARGIVEGLDLYPVLDEGMASEMGADAERQAWDNWIKGEVRDLLSATAAAAGGDGAAEAIEDAFDAADDEELYRVYRDVRADRTDFVVEGASGWVDLKRISGPLAAAFTAKLRPDGAAPAPR